MHESSTKRPYDACPYAIQQTTMISITSLHFSTIGITTGYKFNPRVPEQLTQPELGSLYRFFSSAYPLIFLHLQVSSQDPQWHEFSSGDHVAFLRLDFHRWAR